jgi:hypothetical protein
VRGAWAEVLDRAAAEAGGVQLEDVGPYLRDLNLRGGPQQRWPAVVQFFFYQNHVKDLQAGDATALLDDLAGRAKRIAIVKSVEPATQADFLRRDLLQARREAEQGRTLEAVSQSFSIDALKQRYKWQSAVAENAQAQ